MKKPTYNVEIYIYSDTVFYLRAVRQTDLSLFISSIGIDPTAFYFGIGLPVRFATTRG